MNVCVCCIVMRCISDEHEVKRSEGGIRCRYFPHSFRKKQKEPPNLTSHLMHESLTTVHISLYHMHFWDLGINLLYLEQKLAIGVLLYHSSWPYVEIILVEGKI